MNMPWKVSLNKFKNEMAIQTNLITRYTELLCLLFRYYIEGGKSCLIFGNLVHVALLAVGGSYFFSINNSIQTPSKVLFGESSSQNGLDGQGVNLLAPKERSFNDCTSPDHPTVAKKRQNPSQNEENERWIWTARYSVNRKLSNCEFYFQKYFF